MNWILQDKSFALGNFLNVTPVIKYLYDQTGEKVPVFFETEYVKQCYLSSPFIEILSEKPNDAPFASSAMINRKSDMPDYQYVFKLVTGQIWTNEFKPFIDVPEEVYNDYLNLKYAIVMNGSGSESQNYVDLKNPGREIYKEIISDLQSRGYFVLFTGSYNDLTRLNGLNFDCYEINDIRKSLSLIYEASIVIGNDTGLVHAAGCFDKELFVLWKDTKFTKNMNSGTNTVYSQKDNWREDYNNWIQKFNT